MSELTLLFGLAIFLFAMHSLERGIRAASGDSLNKWMSAGTNNPVSSAATGIMVTAILQSSSMVSLVALAFVSAGIIPLYNGIGIVLGANLGTTVTGWVVTVVGFKMDLQAMVVPLLGIGSAMSLVSSNTRARGLGRALFAFGLLIFGLDLMKQSVAGLAHIVDFSSYQELPSWVFLLIGVLLAAVMQSSSAVMIITLSFLHSETIVLTQAAAIVIGADLGTTSTTILGSLGQSMVKKQLAFAHVFFNLLVNSLAFLFLLPVLPQLLAASSISDPLFGLVAFHSFFNLAGLLLFLPLLHWYTRWIKRVLPQPVAAENRYFEVPVEVPAAALDSLTQARRHLCRRALNMHFAELEINPETVPGHALVSLDDAESETYDQTFEAQYESLKNSEAKLLKYAAKLRLQGLDKGQEGAIRREIEATRSCVYASKTLKDIRADFAQLHHTLNSDFATGLIALHQTFLLQFFRALLPLLFAPHDRAYVREQTEALHELNGRHYDDSNDYIEGCLNGDSQEIPTLSTWFNLNHELHHYSRYMIRSAAALAD
ncbi:MAG: Na/Pi cotransporter family protein [Gammaproteobacteria bacterium]|nr:Na/Pi cotransporter family protein [Gammaproteobacteria bacterium]